jgi:hypothetical protein
VEVEGIGESVGGGAGGAGGSVGDGDVCGSSGETAGAAADEFTGLFPGRAPSSTKKVLSFSSTDESTRSPETILS